MNLKEQIKEDLKTAFKEKNELKKNTLKSILAAFTNELVAIGKTPRDELEDEQMLSVIKRLQKQRKDSIEKFGQAGRDDLVESETQELEIIQKYLPEAMSQEEIEKIAQETKAELGVDDKSKMGILIGAVMKKTGGKADGADVKNVVQKLFD
ncbi:hypothetical protein CSB11_01410 [Candidatus Campbellbacteria bacterium]|nr:MAG: hypothetical protein CSB11_01410 [Candidatus Campbellbacteria bacterium]